jgi:hypothetical protein
MWISRCAGGSWSKKNGGLTTGIDQVFGALLAKF